MVLLNVPLATGNKWTTIPVTPFRGIYARQALSDSSSDVC